MIDVPTTLDAVLDPDVAQPGARRHRRRRPHRRGRGGRLLEDPRPEGAVPGDGRAGRRCAPDTRVLREGAPRRVAGYRHPVERLASTASSRRGSTCACRGPTTPRSTTPPSRRSSSWTTSSRTAVASSTRTRPTRSTPPATASVSSRGSTRRRGGASEVADLAWIVEKFWAWTDCDGDPLSIFTRDPAAVVAAKRSRRSRPPACRRWRS